MLGLLVASLGFAELSQHFNAMRLMGALRQGPTADPLLGDMRTCNVMILMHSTITD